MKSRANSLQAWIWIIVAMAFLGLAQPSHAQSSCKGMTKGKCGSSSSCTWVKGYKTKTGNTVSAYCRSKGSKGAAAKAKSKKADAKAKAASKKKAAAAKSSSAKKKATSKKAKAKDTKKKAKATTSKKKAAAKSKKATAKAKAKAKEKSTSSTKK